MRTFDWILVAVAVAFGAWKAYQAGWLGTVWAKVKPLLPFTKSASDVEVESLELRRTVALETIAKNTAKGTTP